MKCRFSQCVLIENRLYFYDINLGAYAFLDLNTMQVEYLEMGEFNTFLSGFDAVHFMSVYGKKIVSVDNSGKSIRIIDTTNYSKYSIQIDYNGRPWGNFSYCELRNDNVFLFLKKDNQVLQVNLLTSEIKKTDMECSEKIAFTKGVSCGRDRVLLITGNNQYALYNYNLSKIEYSSEFAINIVNIDVNLANEIYAISDKGDIYRLSIVEENLDINMDYICRICDKPDNPYFVVVDTGVFIFSGKKNIHVHTVNFITKDIVSRKINLEFDDKKWTLFKGKCDDSKYVYLASRSCDNLIVLNKKQLTFEVKNYEIDEKRLIDILINNKPVMREKNISLNEFVNHVQKM